MTVVATGEWVKKQSFGESLSSKVARREVDSASYPVCERGEAIHPPLIDRLVQPAVQAKERTSARAVGPRAETGPF